MHRQRFLLPALLLLTAGRFALLPASDLSPVEAVAAAWPELVGPGPLVRFLARLGVWIFGSNEFGVRFFAPLLALTASLCAWRLARGLFGASTAAWTVVILNLLPAFNLSAVTLTAGSVSFACLAGLALCLEIALRHQNRWHPAWLGASACMTAAVLADRGNVILLLVLAAILAWQSGWRQHLLRPGFGMIFLGWLSGRAIWIGLSSEGNPSPHPQPDWRLWPGMLRWLLLISPLLLVWLAWAIRSTLINMRSREFGPPHALLVGLVLPLMFADLGWGGWRPWPDVAFASWTLFGVILLAQASQQGGTLSVHRKVGLRTAALALAALQSLLILHTDKAREFGLKWSFAERTDTKRTWSRFFSQDPSGTMHGWRETAGIVRQMTSHPASAFKDWQLVADRVATAAVLSFYLGRQVETMPHFIGTGPALFISDDARLKKPPHDIAKVLPNSTIATIAEVRHAGQLVRTVKIFACYPERSPDG